jgi:hypothetical protein
VKNTPPLDIKKAFLMEGLCFIRCLSHSIKRKTPLLQERFGKTLSLRMMNVICNHIGFDFIRKWSPLLHQEVNRGLMYCNLSVIFTNCHLKQGIPLYKQVEGSATGFNYFMEKSSTR